MDHSEHALEGVDGPLPSGSIYHLTGEWWDRTGDRHPLASFLGGRVQVVAMVYTHCAQACPAIVAELKRIEAALGPSADVGFVLASMDPERDTPERLRDFASRAALDPARWVLLGAPEGDVMELGAVLGVQFRRLPDGEFAHANMLVVLDRSGEIRHRQIGLGEETAATVNVVRSLIDGPHR
jgi:protein SCO1/2